MLRHLIESTVPYVKYLAIIPACWYGIDSTMVAKVLSMADTYIAVRPVRVSACISRELGDVCSVHVAREEKYVHVCLLSELIIELSFNTYDI